MKHLITTSLFLLLTLGLHAQMWNGQDTLYGNEWIRYDQSYYKFKVADDGVYRIPFEQLQAAGIPTGSVRGQQFQLFHLGEEIPVHVSTDELMAAGDYLEFYGEKNRSELDRYLYTDPDADLLNPEYSLITDSAAYFLTWVPVGTPTLRYTTIENDLTNLPAPEAWYWAEGKRVFSDQLLKRYTKFSGVDIYYSHFDGDGFGHAYTEETTFTLSAPNRYAGGPDASLQINLMGNSNSEGHALQIDMNNQLIESDTFFGTKIRKYQYAFAPASLSDEIELTVRGLNATDRYGVSLGKIRYPATFQFDAPNLASLELPPANGERYLTLNGLLNESYIVLEPEQRLMARVNGSALHELKLPARSGSRQLIWQTASTVNTVSPLKPVQFTDFQEANTNYLIISSDRLFDDGNGNNWVQTYADYRSSPDGGNYQTAIIEIQQLFDQFAYGIDFHPLSVRNGFYYLFNKRLQDLEYVFMIGRGQEYRSMRNPEALTEAIASADMLIPSFGYPASDNLLFTTNETIVSPVPIGRLAAINGGEVKIYLDKVKAVEESKMLPQTIADRAWTKNVLHLGGGSQAGEQENIKRSLEQMAQELEQNSYGATVKAFYKNSTDVIQNSLSQEIFEFINKGTSIITFFGHSSPGTFDFNIDNPDNYDNQGRYPLVLSLGCYSGNIFGPSRSIGERFSFYEDKAAVVFGASRGLGLVSSLAIFAQDFYRNIGEEYYGSSIGHALRAAYLENHTNNWLGIQTLIEQFILHGDPAIRLHPVDGPDYVVDAASVSFGEQPITSLMDSLTFSFDAVNIGKNVNDTISLVVSRTFPDGEQIDLLKDTISMDRFRKSLQYTIAVGGFRSTGQNLFHVRIDADEQIAESPNPAAEMNNELTRSNGETGIPLFIIDNTARAVYPPEFALIGDPDITLKASTTNALAPERTYWLEVDTTARFDSPLKVRLTQTQRGGVLKWAPTINWQDQTAYYWRVSPAVSEDNPEAVWSNSSFTYIAGSEPGWRQGHYWQFKQNTETDLVFTDSTQEVSFGQEFLDMRVRNKLWDRDNPPGFFYNNDNPAVSVRPWRYLDQGVGVMVFEPNNGVNWRNTGQQYGSVDGRNNGVFSFDTRTKEVRDSLNYFLTEIIPDGHFVFFFTIQNNELSDYSPEQWSSDSLTTGKNTFSILESEGAGAIRALINLGSVPYILLYEKGIGVRAESIAGSIFDVINSTTVIPRVHTSGELKSQLIGPAENWKSLTWTPLPEMNINQDTIVISLLGIQPNGTIDTLVPDVNSSLLLDHISADNYPFIQFGLKANDDVSRTPAIVDSWTVFYDGVPEFAINPASNTFLFQSDSLAQGADILLKTTVENLSIYPSDSIDINFQLINQSNQEQISTQRLAPLTGNGEINFEYQLSSSELQGNFTLTAEVNPERKQLEHHYFNNLLSKNFIITSDRKNPLLDVTFDGRVLLNGDMVGANPFISIRLKDENPYLLLTDTSLVRLELARPNGSRERISLNSSELQYTTAKQGDKNELLIEYQPSFTEDGTYQLAVNGQDVSGNFSGKIDYQVAFEVRTRNSISNILNYPNPFSTSTQFVYTLTGNAPTFFKIQILNVSGRVVREITQDEIGPLRVGTHRTDFAWDGRDEFGDQLANGIYLYRIIAKDENGKDFESYDDYIEDTGLAGFFERGFGKMVLLR